MKTSVQNNFASFSVRFEGRLTFMYLDITNLVTTGIGNLIDPIGLALSLPWQVGGTPSSESEITDAWNTVKSRTDLSHSGGGAFGGVTNLRLTNDDVDALVASKAAGMETSLKSRAPFADFDDWPADAQLGLLSMAWAMGPLFNFPKFQGFCAALDFRSAADECRISEIGNPGVIPRNDANQALFRSAADVIDSGGDFEELHLP